MGCGEISALPRMLRETNRANRISGGEIVETNSADRESKSHLDCVRCGLCVSYCPNCLRPDELGILAEHGFYEELEDWDVSSCTECGTCEYVCPSERPIVEFITRATSALDSRDDMFNACKKGGSC